jgi:16S rRNA (guanine966-N2)-methyltransferase
VTRIIAGALGSLQLKAAAKATRPTSDRVKESLFGKLDSMGAIEEAVVLDLFAGTGALGLEAISRGAKKAVLVEKDRTAFNLLTQNLELVKKSLAAQKLDAQLSAFNLEAGKFLKTNTQAFDLVFIDPPYDFNQIAETLGNLDPHLNEGALVVLERSAREVVKDFDGFEISEKKTFGDTAVYFLNKN